MLACLYPWGDISIVRSTLYNTLFFCNSYLYKFLALKDTKNGEISTFSTEIRRYRIYGEKVTNKIRFYGNIRIYMVNISV